MVSSGIRVGTPAVTTRGFKEAEVSQLAHWMCDVLDDVNAAAVIAKTREAVQQLCRRFPVYGS
jgi:glycine hydroxymethyltransferase